MKIYFVPHIFTAACWWCRDLWGQRNWSHVHHLKEGISCIKQHSAQAAVTLCGWVCLTDTSPSLFHWFWTCFCEKCRLHIGWLLFTRALSIWGILNTKSSASHLHCQKDLSAHISLAVIYFTSWLRSENHESRDIYSSNKVCWSLPHHTKRFYFKSSYMWSEMLFVMVRGRIVKHTRHQQTRHRK